MTEQNTPPPPTRNPPDANWQHFSLYERVRDAIASLPVHFRSDTVIGGISATDLHTLNTVLGAAIEEQVVRTLNAIRAAWDPDDEYALYYFVRQPQTFPDVLLRRPSDEHIILGIELKGWYLLAKEGEPSLRFQVTKDACADSDLVVVVPWCLSNVISGSPIVFPPYIELARYAAEYRNHHWQHIRNARTSVDIELPEGVTPYPSKSDNILDNPVSDRGGNFGRVARTGIMDEYIKQAEETLQCGVQIRHWRAFLKAFHENASDQEIADKLKRLSQNIRGDSDDATSQQKIAGDVISSLARLLEIDLE